VETHDGPTIEYQDGSRRWIGPRTERPRLDVAHDLLAKLPERYAPHYYGPHKMWTAEIGTTPDTLSIRAYKDFESAVIALAEMAAAEKERDHG
jgi:hypothetical protein